jgi:uncharacterized protein YwqG
MKRKYTINFRESKNPITEPVTKFGGQPVWIEKPEWAVSRSTNKPMMFVCQIELKEEIFGQVSGKMAYIFMNDEDVDGTFDPNSGENAIIIQPNGKNPKSVNIESGPTLYNVSEGFKYISENQIPCEFLAELELGNDPDLEEDILEENLDKAMSEIKIGGIPVFLQSEEFPDKEKENWNLLLQLDSCSIPFEINFGDAGVGYAFVSKDGKTGKFLWQCC